jgi:hypothetical protein
MAALFQTVDADRFGFFGDSWTCVLLKFRTGALQGLMQD